MAFTPALGFRFLTPLYDKVVAITCRESTFKRKIVNIVIEDLKSKIYDTQDTFKVLDIACGTGTLLQKLTSNLLPIKRKFELVGLDIDPEVLNLAKNKFEHANINQYISLIQGSATQLPFEDNSFDVVTTSLFFHHLQNEQKYEAMEEMKRVLKPNGKIIIADWGTPANFIMRICFFGIQLLDGRRTTSAHVKGIVDSILQQKFTNISTIAIINTIFGTLRIHTAIK